MHSYSRKTLKSTMESTVYPKTKHCKPFLLHWGSEGMCFERDRFCVTGGSNLCGSIRSDFIGLSGVHQTQKQQSREQCQDLQRVLMSHYLYPLPLTCVNTDKCMLAVGLSVTAIGTHTIAQLSIPVHLPHHIKTASQSVSHSYVGGGALQKFAPLIWVAEIC